MAYVKRHATNNLKKSINYIVNKNKTDELLIYENQLPSSDVNEIVDMMNLTKENFNKTGGIQGHHFIQSFSPDENITLELAHQVGREWSEEFIGDYEFVLSTHKDKEHIHNHIIINSVNAKDGKKYLSNIKEREYIRSLSDEVCKTHNLSIIKPLEKDKVVIGSGVSYGEWKYQKESISWKDRIKNDIDDSIKHSDNYKEFIEQMKKKNYELRYGERYKYNSFEHFDIGKRIRGKTLGEEYTEKVIKERILNKELESEEHRIFFEEHYFLNGVSNKEIVHSDIDLSILEVTTYDDFIKSMEDKNYELRYGEKYKYNSFKHANMKKAVRGRTIGYDYTETKIVERISTNKELLRLAETKQRIELEKQTIFSKRYVNNKFKYLKIPQLNQVTEKQKEDFGKKQQSLKLNQIVHFLKQNDITEVKEYIEFKKDVEQKVSSLIKHLNTIALTHKKLMNEYNETPSESLKNKLVANAKKHEVSKKEYEELNKVRAEFKYADKYLTDKKKEKNKEQEQGKKKEQEKKKGKEKGYGDIIR